MGILDKVAAIEIQQTANVDTAEAFRQLGHDPDPRDFSIHVQALRMVFAGSKITFGTHNPQKLQAVRNAGIEIAEVVQLDVPLTPDIVKYRQEKAEVLRHDYELGSRS